jgi:hypothetical protein
VSFVVRFFWHLRFSRAFAAKFFFPIRDHPRLSAVKILPSHFSFVIYSPIMSGYVP